MSLWVYGAIGTDIYYFEKQKYNHNLHEYFSIAPVLTIGPPFFTKCDCSWDSINPSVLNMYRKCSIECVQNTLFTPPCYSKNAQFAQDTFSRWKLYTYWNYSMLYLCIRRMSQEYLNHLQGSSNICGLLEVDLWWNNCAIVLGQSHLVYHFVHET